MMLIGQNVVAQSTFFVTPLINYKIEFCSYPSDQRFGNLYSEQSFFGIQNPYYSFEAKKASTRPAINIGLRVGASFRGHKHILHLEWSQDGAGTMGKTSQLTTTNLEGSNIVPEYSNYINGIGYYQTGFAYNRISLAYGVRLTQEKYLCKLYLTTDFSTVFGDENSMNKYYEQSPTSTSVYYHNNAKHLSTEINSYHFGVVSSLIGIGVKGDIGVKIKDKSLYLFSAEVNYRQGFKVIGSSLHTTRILDNNEVIGFSNELVTKGSGVYFQISRNIQLYPWRPNRKPKI